MSSDKAIRKGALKDLKELVRLEKIGFDSDQFGRPQFRYLLGKANATTLVFCDKGRLLGNAIMLWRTGSHTGRLYTITVDPESRGKNIGSRLLGACEEEALRQGCNRIVLEVRSDNRAAISLYEKFGYLPVKSLPGYYSNGMNGLRMNKVLKYSGRPEILLDIPYYAQTLDFTCGPSSLMMAMKYFDSEIHFSRIMELMLWKETTTIFMSAGFGGCGPVELAVAAARRGFKCRVVMGKEQTPFLASVRSKERKDVVRLVHQAMRQEATKLGVRIEYCDFTFKDIAEAIRRNIVPVVLISTYRLHKDRSPHWVVVTGFDNHNVYYHDPYKDFFEHGDKQARNVRIPIPEFHLVRHYGKDDNRNVVFIEGPSKKGHN